MNNGAKDQVIQLFLSWFGEGCGVSTFTTGSKNSLNHPKIVLFHQ